MAMRSDAGTGDAAEPCRAPRESVEHDFDIGTHGEELRRVSSNEDGDSSVPIPVAMPRDSCFRQQRSVEFGVSLSIKNSPIRRKASRFIHNNVTEGFVAVIIFYNFILICIDTDARSDFPGHEGEDYAPSWVGTSMDVCFIFYVVETMLKILVEAGKFLHTYWNIFDIVVIVFGLFEYVIKWQAFHIDGIAALRIFHLCRLLRLLRVIRLFAVLKELRRLMHMFAGCFKTLGWACCLLFMVMTIWACVFVEIINPIVQDLGETTSAWDGCDRCRRAFASVFEANITIFQTVVAQDSWGRMALPIIEEQPWTVLIFAVSLMTIMFGVLNLIVAVIVDTCAEMRNKDFVSKALDMDHEEIEEKRVLAKMFERIDEDGSGSVTWDELKKASTKVSEFRHWLRAMDIDSQDLQQLFLIVDEDGSGSIDPEEFIDAMYRLKNSESRTTTKLIKHVVGKIEKDTGDLKASLDEMRHLFISALAKDMSPRHRLVLESDEKFIARLRQHEETVSVALEAALEKAKDTITEAALQVASQSVDGTLFARPEGHRAHQSTWSTASSSPRKSEAPRLFGREEDDENGTEGAAAKPFTPGPRLGAARPPPLQQPLRPAGVAALQFDRSRSPSPQPFFAPAPEPAPGRVPPLGPPAVPRSSWFQSIEKGCPDPTGPPRPSEWSAATAASLTQPSESSGVLSPRRGAAFAEPWDDSPVARKSEWSHAFTSLARPSDRGGVRVSHWGLQPAPSSEFSDHQDTAQQPCHSQSDPFVTDAQKPPPTPPSPRSPTGRGEHFMLKQNLGFKVRIRDRSAVNVPGS